MICETSFYNTNQFKLRLNLKTIGFDDFDKIFYWEIENKFWCLFYNIFEIPNYNF